MSETKIVPEKITRPIQLLAAWLIGLIVIDGAFLTAASQIENPNWAAGVLVLASVINVPLFLISIFLLQTKFRPEMQEDVYYSKYLEQQFSGGHYPPESIDMNSQIKSIAENIIQQIAPELEGRREPIERLLKATQIEIIAKRVGNERTLSELYLRPELWESIADEWEDNPTFIDNVDRLVEEGVLSMKKNDYSSCQLSDFGRKVAEFSQENNMLFAQQVENKTWWEEEGDYHLTKESRG